jgi:hypothetical protein
VLKDEFKKMYQKKGPLNLPAMLVDRRRRRRSSIVDGPASSTFPASFPAMLETSTTLETLIAM